MTYGAFTPRDPFDRDLAPFRGHRPSRSSVPYAMICAGGLTLGTSLGLLILYKTPLPFSDGPAPRAAQALAPSGEPAAVAQPKALMPKVLVSKPLVSKPVVGLFDPTFDADHASVTFDRTILLAARFEIAPRIEQDTDSPLAAAIEPPIVPPLPMVSELVSNVPLPMPRPSFLMPPAPIRPTRLATRTLPVNAHATSPGQPGFFEKLFGSRPEGGTALAYAAPDDFGLARGPVARTLAAYGQRAAVYDIAAHTVYLPDGARLEAHSGLGSRLDDPRSVAEHMRGATPPAVYELTLREQPFHGVRALRLNPIGGGTVYGRAGLLAHTYMLGPRGDSNGCVVFRDYRAFLQAYESGVVNRLVVVSSLN